MKPCRALKAGPCAKARSWQTAVGLGQGNDLPSHRSLDGRNDLLLLALLACEIALAAEPKRVMLLHSFGRDFRPWNEYANTIRTELVRQSSWPLDIIDHSLVTARFSDDDSEIAFVEYLRALYAKRPLDLIICLGAPAADFVQRHRQRALSLHTHAVHSCGAASNSAFQSHGK